MELKTKEKNELLNLINIVSDYELVMEYCCQIKNNFNNNEMSIKNGKLKNKKIPHASIELKFDQMMKNIKNKFDLVKIKNKFYHAYVLTKKNIKAKYLECLRKKKKNLKYGENRYPMINFLKNFELLLKKKD